MMYKYGGFNQNTVQYQKHSYRAVIHMDIKQRNDIVLLEKDRQIDQIKCIRIFPQVFQWTNFQPFLIRLYRQPTNSR